MKIKIIDLYNKKEKPKQIKYKNYIWNLDENNLYDCKDVAIDLDVYLASVQICDLGRINIDNIVTKKQFDLMKYEIGG